MRKRMENETPEDSAARMRKEEREVKITPVTVSDSSFYMSESGVEEIPIVKDNVIKKVVNKIKKTINKNRK